MNTGRQYNYVVLRVLTNSAKDVAIPFGLAYWEHDPKEALFRLPQAGEEISGVSGEVAQMYPRFVERLRQAMRTGRLSYGDELDAYSLEWWEHLRNLEIHRFRLDTPKKIEVQDPAIDFDLQFAALVQPTVAVQKEDERIDRLLSRAMGVFAPRFKSHGEIPGFKDRPVKFLRTAKRGSDFFAIDAVNLTTREAMVHMEAMLHRANEVLHSQHAGKVKVILAYAASPEGLNGEAKLVEMGEQIIGRPLLSLSTDETALQQAVMRELDNPDTFELMPG